MVEVKEHKSQEKRLGIKQAGLYYGRDIDILPKQ
jgi:hypothetical protein